VPDDLFVAPEEELAAGTMVGEYRIQRKLGSGTFGDVYAGEHPLIGKRVAVKILNQRFASDPVMISRFIAEARAVNKIRQRNIIDIFSFGVLPGLERHYFVMELLDGLTLGELLDKQRRLPMSTVLPIVRGIAEALDAVHEAGITHRDLKPDNVFLATERDGSYFPKLLDFGIAKLIGDEVAHKTGPGMVLGTPRYMSPEQARGRVADHHADIYALGVMIHEMLAGEAPFTGQSSVDVLLKHTAEPPPRLSEMCPDLPAELDAPVLHMLEKRPADRPRTAGGAVQALAERAQRLGLDKPGAPISGVNSERETLPADSDAVWSNPTVIDGQAGAQLAEGARAGAKPAAIDETQREAGAALEDAPHPARRASPRAAHEGRSGPSTEELSVIETDSSIGKSGWSRRVKVVAASLGALAVGFSVWALGHRSTSAVPVSSSPLTLESSALPVPMAPVAPAPIDTGAEPQVKPSMPLPQVIELRLSSRPADVEVWLGDRKLGSAAAPLQLPRAAEPIELRLKKPGYKDELLKLTPDHDQTAEATLSPLFASPPGKPAVANGKPPAAPGKLDRILGDRE
jgi:serine/threonine-protein kinase